MEKVSVCRGRSGGDRGRFLGQAMAPDRQGLIYAAEQNSLGLLLLR
jgi:hypothetical protein